MGFRVPGLLLGMISLFGLTQGLPEFFQARGLFIDLETVGPLKVVAHEDAVVVLGNYRNGGFILTSKDGSDWTLIDDETVTELELVDGIADGPATVVVGHTEEAEAVVLVSEDGRHYEESGRFGHSDYGTVPRALSAFRGGLVSISDIIGNDVEFHTSNDYQTWTPAQPSPVFDDGEGAQDITCGDEVCVGVGFFDATYRSELDANTGAAWVNTTGGEFQPVGHDFAIGTLDAVAWTPSGFLVVANSASGHGVAWHGIDGTEWRPISAPFTEMTVDGAEAIDRAYMVFGHDPVSGDLFIWKSEDATDWSEALIATGLPQGSEIRSVARTKARLTAVGVDAETLDTLIWTSPEGNIWQQAAVIGAR